MTTTTLQRVQTHDRTGYRIALAYGTRYVWSRQTAQGIVETIGVYWHGGHYYRADMRIETTPADLHSEGWKCVGISPF